MLDLTDDSVWSNLFYLLPVPVAFLIGPVPGVVCLLASANLAYYSGRYHTTYEREEQGEDVHAMLTYLAALTGTILSPVSPWFLLLPFPADVLHRRYVWSIDSYVAVPIYILFAIGVLGWQVGLSALFPFGFALAGGAVKVAQPGVRSHLHSLWHLCGGLAAMLALLVLIT